MLKGHVFSRQLFGHPIFALFINTFLNGANGVSDNYKNGMAITYSGSNVTIDGGAAIIQGRPVEEDTSTTISVGTDNAYCKLVVEINLDEVNTESEFKQASYKIIKSANSYPALTQTNIVKNNAGIYQYELARFRTSANGISDFQDMRTFLDFDSIYDAMQTEYRSILGDLEEELQEARDGSLYVLNSLNEMTLNSSCFSGNVSKMGKYGLIQGEITFNVMDGASEIITTMEGTVFEEKRRMIQEYKTNATYQFNGIYYQIPVFVTFQLFGGHVSIRVTVEGTPQGSATGTVPILFPYITK